jgi:hypothetical protein
MGRTQAPTGELSYGYAYQKLRKALLPSAYGTPCVRCGQPMLPAQRLHVDHDDYDRTKLRGFAHAACNIRAAAKKARAIQIAAKRRVRQGCAGAARARLGRRDVGHLLPLVARQRRSDA